MKEKAIIERAVAGDQIAYRQLYQLYEKAARSRAGVYFKWKADIDDVVLESFQKAFAALPGFDTGREFRPWLLTIVQRTALDHLYSIRREDSKTEREENIPDTTTDDFTPEEEIIRDEVHRRLMGFIDELPSLYKDVMIKYMIEELEYEEISRQLDLGLNTVRTRIRRGKQHLSDMMLRGEVE